MVLSFFKTRALLRGVIHVETYPQGYVGRSDCGTNAERENKIIFFHSFFAHYCSSYKPVGAAPWPRNESCPTASGVVCVLFLV